MQILQIIFISGKVLRKQWASSINCFHKFAVSQMKNEKIW